jgi:hypothetical protein
MSLKQRKGAASAAAVSDDVDSSSGASSSSSTPSAAAASSAVPKLVHSTSSYDYVAGQGSLREVAAARASLVRGSGFLAGFSGGSEFVFQAVILLAICVLAFMVRLFSVVRYESVIHEVSNNTAQHTRKQSTLSG